MPPKKGTARAKDSAQTEQPPKDQPKIEGDSEMAVELEQLPDIESEKPDLKGEFKEEDEEKVNDKREPETDAVTDPRPKLTAGSVYLNSHDSTLNAIATSGGCILLPLVEGGMQYLLAGIRCNTAIKAGRYLFESRIVENLNPLEFPGSGRAPQPRQLVRLGFSLAQSSLFVADGSDNFGFDSDGFFIHAKSRKKVAQKFVRDQTVSLLLNLDSNSNTKNTVSLFVNGKRACEPQPIPPDFNGKALYPTVTYKNVSVEINFGPTMRAPLPFIATTLSNAAIADVEVAQAPPLPKGKPEVLFPVGLPEQGFFDWVDDFLEKNPDYTELSERKIIEWASKSGVWRPGGAVSGSTDKPHMQLGLPGLEDGSVQKVLAAVAPTLSRRFIVPELKRNLVAKERQESLLQFCSHEFHRKAVVIIGEPNSSFKSKVQSLLLMEKQQRAEAEKKRRAQQEEARKQQESRRKKSEEAKKSLEGTQTKRLRSEAALDQDQADGLDREDISEHEEEADADAADDEGSKIVSEETDVVIELTEEEKQLWYRKTTTPDMSERDLAKSYAQFALPDKSEGFDEIAFEWQDEASCKSLFKAWVMEKKLTQRAEDLQPGAAFKDALAKWSNVFQEWRHCQADLKDPVRKKAAAARKLEAAKQKREAEKQSLIEAGDEEGAKALDEQVDEPAPDIDLENIDVMAVDDVMDIGNGEPLFVDFAYEDWSLLSTRFELHLLVHSFKQDLNDPDRPSFGLKHLPYYYNKYFRKAWNLQLFGLKDFDELLELLKDSISLDAATGHLKADQPQGASFDVFVKFAEENRRERQRRLDAGDETAKLRFTRPAPNTGRPSDKGYGKGPGTASTKGSHNAPGRYSGGKGSAQGPSGPRYGSSSYSPPSNAPYSSQKRSYPTQPTSYGGQKQTRSGTYGGTYGAGAAGRR